MNSKQNYFKYISQIVSNIIRKKVIFESHGISEYIYFKSFKYIKILKRFWMFQKYIFLYYNILHNYFILILFLFHFIHNIDEHFIF